MSLCFCAASFTRVAQEAYRPCCEHPDEYKQKQWGLFIAEI